MNDDVIPKPDAEVAKTDTPASFDLLLEATKQGLSVEQIKAFKELYVEDQMRLAKQQFNAAFAKFQQECPPIHKTHKAGATRDGGLKWDYAPIDQVMSTISPHLKNNGLSVAFETDESEREWMKVGCVIRHIGGFEYRPPAYVTPIAGNKAVNLMQQHASAWNYARRIALMGALGLTPTDEDDDGSGGASVETITLDQEEHLRQLLDRLAPSEAAIEKFWTFAGVRALAEIPVGQFDRVEKALTKKVEDKEARG